MLRLEAALLGIGEALGGKLEGSKIGQDVASMREAFLEPGGKRTDQGCALRVRSYDRDRLGQQPRSFRIRGSDAIGGDEGERFALTQTVALRRPDELPLAFLAHGAQGIGERRPDRSLVGFAGDVRGKFRGQGQATHDPGLAPAEQLCGTCETEPVLVEQGLDDARLIHRRRRARRRVRTQEQKFLLDRRAGALDNRRHCRTPLVRPAGDPFEAVHDFEKTVSGFHDPDGKVSELGRQVAPRLNAPQPLMAPTHEPERNRAHEFRRLVRHNRVDGRHPRHRCASHRSAR